MKDIECPYCKHEQKEPDDCYEPNERYEVECDSCKKTFHAICEYYRTWDTVPTPCLNESGEHNFKPVNGYPEEYFKNLVRCSYCSEEKRI